MRRRPPPGAGPPQTNFAQKEPVSIRGISLMVILATLAEGDVLDWFNLRETCHEMSPAAREPSWSIRRRAILNGCCDLILLALISTSACSRKGPERLLNSAVQAEAEAKLAFEKRDVHAADLAAARAEEATERLKKLAEANELIGQNREQLLPAAVAAKLSAGNFAQLAHEDQQRREVLASFKLTAYQRVRSAVLSFGL